MTKEADKSVQILSDIAVFNKYAKYDEVKKRRETWDEICDRYEDMLSSKYPHLSNEIKEKVQYVRDKKVLPSMRALQFAGEPIRKNNSRLYNCAYLPIDNIRAFSETMFLLLGGTGVGYSVQFHHIDKLPEIKKPVKKRRFLIGDSIEGWADAVKVLMKAYFEGRSLPDFDFSDIREKGAKLLTAGGKAPGPEPLKECLFQIQKILDRKEDGDKLTTLEAHDIQCHIADAVLSGGIRRAAMIALFSFDDEDMRTCKFGNWWELNEQRGRANNSAVLLRHRVKEGDFWELWNKIKYSGSGEPGIYFSNNEDWGSNPCCEISLRPFQFCNLTEVNVSDVYTQKELDNRSRVASFLGTLQASFTNFHYLRDVWKKTTEKEALIGVGQTGVGSGNVLPLNLKQSSEVVKEENKKIAEEIGINSAARTTTVKPSGTTSLVLGTSSGIHGWYNDYYIRRMRIGKNESLYNYIVSNHPELVEDDYFKPKNQAVISVPQKSPENAIYRQESPINLLERVKRFNSEWVKNGHRKGANTNNVSATISIKDNEWEQVGKWMWENKDNFNGLSVLPYDGGTYIQAPFEDIDKETYENMYENLQNIDLRYVREEEDNTDLTQEAACAGGKCEI